MACTRYMRGKLQCFLKKGLALGTQDPAQGFRETLGATFRQRINGTTGLQMSARLQALNNFLVDDVCVNDV